MLPGIVDSGYEIYDNYLVFCNKLSTGKVVGYDIALHPIWPMEYTCYGWPWGARILCWLNQ